jgi:hypothetical protein
VSAGRTPKSRKQRAYRAAVDRLAEHNPDDAALIEDYVIWLRDEAIRYRVRARALATPTPDRTAE